MNTLISTGSDLHIKTKTSPISCHFNSSEHGITSVGSFTAESSFLRTIRAAKRWHSETTPPPPRELYIFFLSLPPDKTSCWLSDFQYFGSKSEGTSISIRVVSSKFTVFTLRGEKTSRGENQSSVNGQKLGPSSPRLNCITQNYKLNKCTWSLFLTKQL